MRNLLMIFLLSLLPCLAFGKVCDPGNGDGNGGGLEGCSDMAELTISGTVTTVCALEVAPLPAATALDIIGGESGTPIATVTEMSNNTPGYQVFVSSANNGVLTHSTAAGEEIPYQLSYDGGALFSPTTTNQEVKDSGALVGFTETDSEVSITFAGDTSAIAGTYRDTITFEIQGL